MCKNFTTYWYRDEPAVGSAGLFHLRDDDLRLGGGICRGEIFQGHCGFQVAERDVPGFRGRTVAYLPNRCCEWFGFYLTCMAHKGLPEGPVRRSQAGGLRHKQYVVAELSSPAALQRAREMEGMQVITAADGRKLVNLETATIPGKNPKHRKAQLL
jgi:hypothetical protein